MAPAGNQLFQGFGSVSRQVDDDAGLSVMSFSHEPTSNLFAFAVGTSFAAPQVARLAAQRPHTQLSDAPPRRCIQWLVQSVARTLAYRSLRVNERVGGG